VHIGENPGVVMRWYSNVMLIWSFFFFFFNIYIFIYVCQEYNHGSTTRV
jgi:hypothetical protein